MWLVVIISIQIPPEAIASGGSLFLFEKYLQLLREVYIMRRAESARAGSITMLNAGHGLWLCHGFLRDSQLTLQRIVQILEDALRIDLV